MQAPEPRYSNFFRISYVGPPPQVPSTWEPSRAFSLPSYEQVEKMYELNDSMRLPAYRSCQLNRHHPYCPSNHPRQQTEGIKYENTIYDDQYVPLNVPARVGLPQPTPPLLPYGLAEHITDADSIDQGLSDMDVAEHSRRLHEFEAERWNRIGRLHTAIVDFVHTFRGASSPSGRRFRTLQHLVDTSEQLEPPQFTEVPYSPVTADIQPDDTSIDYTDEEATDTAHE